MSKKIDPASHGEAVVVAVRLTQTTIKEIDAIVTKNASRLGTVTRSTVARALIAEALEARKPAQCACCKGSKQ